MISFRDFQREINHAQSMLVSSKSEEMKAYWRYYMHGLRRLYHGEKYQSIEMHRFRLSLEQSQDTIKQRQGEGYRHGFSYDKARGGCGIGRKQVGEVQIPALLVSRKIRSDLKKLRDITGESAPDMRRRFLEIGIMQELNRWTAGQQT